MVTPVIEGHGENHGKEFISIQQSAKTIVALIKNKYGGKVKLLYGLSLGGQIVCECLAIDQELTEYAVIESALVKPSPAMASLVGVSYKLFYPLIKHPGFSASQAKALYIPPQMFELYYRDTNRMTKTTLVNIGKSNMRYSLNPAIGKTKAKTLIVYGSKEIKAIKASAQLLNEKIKNSRLFIAQGLKHGEYSLRYPEECGQAYMTFCRS